MVASAPNHLLAEEPLESVMSRYVAGEHAAFDELYRRVSPRIFAALLHLTGDRARAEDVLQTTFLKIYRARETYLPGSPVLPWALVIAKRTWYDEQRPLSARYEQLTADGSVADQPARSNEAEHETVDRLRHALEQLPKQYREAIELTKLSGYSGHEAAQSLNTTAAAIKQRVHRGYALLRALLSPPPGGDALPI
jgi:RNA polymerase sigma factor (sigma-70 family)